MSNEGFTIFLAIKLLQYLAIKLSMYIIYKERELQICANYIDIINSFGVGNVSLQHLLDTAQFEVTHTNCHKVYVLRERAGHCPADVGGHVRSVSLQHDLVQGDLNSIL